MADLIERDAVIWITAETGALETQRRVRELPAVNRWISVEDALPDAFLYVICAGKDGMAILRYNGEVWVDDAGCVYSMSAITHWMSLPEPPEKRWYHD